MFGFLRRMDRRSPQFSSQTAGTSLFARSAGAASFDGCRAVCQRRPRLLHAEWYRLVITTSSTQSPLLANDVDVDGGTLSASLVSGRAMERSQGSVQTARSHTRLALALPDLIHSRMKFPTVRRQAILHMPRLRLVVSSRRGQIEMPLTTMASFQTGAVQLTENLVSGVDLAYSSDTLAKPIVVVETALLSGAGVPDEITPS